jgi:hypothetical protein
MLRPLPLCVKTRSGSLYGDAVKKRVQHRRTPGTQARNVQRRSRQVLECGRALPLSWGVKSYQLQHSAITELFRCLL